MDKLTTQDLMLYIGHNLEGIDLYDGKVKKFIGLICDGNSKSEIIISYNGVISNRYVEEFKPIFRRIDFIDSKEFSLINNIHLTTLEKTALKAYGKDSGRVLFKDLKMLASLHIDLCNAIPRGLAVEIKEGCD